MSEKQNNLVSDKVDDGNEPGDVTAESNVITEGTKQNEAHQTSEPGQGVKPKVLQDSNNKEINIEKQQEQKLLSKHPGLGGKPAGSKFLQKRLSKGRMFFDSGDYNMSKTTENRASSKIVSKTPTRITTDSSEDDHKSEEDNEEDDVMDPTKQAIPTPDLLFLRRAARHMPMAQSSGPASRRATVQTRGMSVEDAAVFGDTELVAAGPVVHPNLMARRRATLQVPSKLAD